MAYPDASMLIEISIPSTSYVINNGEAYTQYIIRVLSADKVWSVRRRFSEFFTLHQKLRVKYPSLMRAVDFPERTPFNMARSVTYARQQRLEQYLRLIQSISVPRFMDDESHQAEHSTLLRMRELDEFLDLPVQTSSTMHGHSSEFASYADNDVPIIPSEAEMSIMDETFDAFFREFVQPESRTAVSQLIQTTIKKYKKFPIQDPLCKIMSVADHVDELSERIMSLQSAKLRFLLSEIRRSPSLLDKSVGDKPTRVIHNSEQFDVSNELASRTDSDMQSDFPQNEVEMAHLHANSAHEMYMRQRAKWAIEQQLVPPLASDLLYRSHQLGGSTDRVYRQKVEGVKLKRNSSHREFLGVPGEHTHIAVKKPTDGSYIHWISSPIRWDEAIAHLLAMERSKLPTEMASRLHDAVSSICRALKMAAKSHRAMYHQIQAYPTSSSDEKRDAESDNTSSTTLENDYQELIAADDILSMLIYIMSLADLERPATCCEYMRCFHPHGPYSCNLAHFEAATHYIVNLSFLPASADSRTISLKEPAELFLLRGLEDETSMKEKEKEKEEEKKKKENKFYDAEHNDLFRQISSNSAAKLVHDALITSTAENPNCASSPPLSATDFARRAFANAGVEPNRDLMLSSDDQCLHDKTLRELLQRNARNSHFAWILYPSVALGYNCVNICIGVDLSSQALRRSLEKRFCSEASAVPDSQWHHIYETIAQHKHDCNDEYAKHSSLCVFHVVILWYAENRYYFQVPQVDASLPTITIVANHSISVTSGHTTTSDKMIFAGPYNCFDSALGKCILYYLSIE